MIDHAYVIPTNNDDDCIEYVLPNLNNQTHSHEEIYFTHRTKPKLSSVKGNVKRDIPKYDNINIDEQDEYVILNVDNQRCLNRSKRINDNANNTTNVPSKKGRVVVEGMPEGIYELAGKKTHDIYDLSAAASITETDDESEDTLTIKYAAEIPPYKLQILTGLAVFLALLGIFVGFILGIINIDDKNAKSGGKITIIKTCV